MSKPGPLPLAGVHVAITRPAGTGAALARLLRARGAQPLLLPGSSLRAAADAATARAALTAALGADFAIFTSPAAVRFARALRDIHGRARILAPGSGTARALQRHGRLDVLTPDRENSEGLLAMAALHDVRNKRIGIVGAEGGRGLLERELASRGATVVHAYVYVRRAARLDHRHATALAATRDQPLYVLLSSAEALHNLLAGLPADACHLFLAASAIASSERLAGAASEAGFKRVLHAASAHAGDLLAAVIADRG